VFGDATFEAVQTRIGVVAARWMEERPMIFKADINQAFGRQATFKPGFGAKIGDAVVASCAAYPFFNKQIVATSQGDVELVDGGYCANNPTLCAVSQVPHVLRVGARIRLCSRDRLFRTGRNADREFPQAAFRELHDKAPKHQ
jgi:patatin-like phospholipase/acyl hydrolase